MSEAYRVRDGETPADRNRRVNKRALVGTGRWMRRHKIVTVIAALVVIGSCSAVVSPPDEPEPTASARPAPLAQTPSAAATNKVSASTTPTTTPTPTSPATPTAPETATETPAPVAPVLTQDQKDQRRWGRQYSRNRSDFYTAIATAAPLLKMPEDFAAESVAACADLSAGLAWRTRIKGLQTRWTGPGSAPSVEQSRRVFAAVTGSICRDQKPINQQQAAANPPPAPKPSPPPQPTKPVYTYYANCTAVEAAGAAPIYLGDPGYSRDLDRDGDGVACEQ